MKHFSLIILIALILISCEEQQRTLKPRIIGDPSDVLVVADKNIWEGSVGDSLRYVLSEPYPMLPQYEPQFDLRHLEPVGFEGYEKRAGTTIILSIGDKEQNRTPRLTQARDTWANGQRVFTIYALTDTAFYRILNQYKDQLLYELNKISTQRGVAAVKFTQIPHFTEVIKERFGFEIVIPEGFQITVDQEHVLCFQRRRERSLKLPQMGVRSHDIVDQIAIYKYEHKSDSTFTLNSQMAIRDSILGKYIRSSSDYPMITETKLKPLLEETTYLGHYSVLMRGLWKFKRPLMGGPFVSVNFYNENTKFAVGVEGNVFAPKFDKRDYIREVESIIFSTSFNTDTLKIE